MFAKILQVYDKIEINLNPENEDESSLLDQCGKFLSIGNADGQTRIIFSPERWIPENHEEVCSD